MLTSGLNEGIGGLVTFGLNSTTGAVSIPVEAPVVPVVDERLFLPQRQWELVTLPVSYQVYVRKRWWILRQPIDAWMDPPQRDIALKEVAKATRGWSQWRVKERRSIDRASHYAFFRPRVALSAVVNGKEVIEVSAQFTEAELGDISKFRAKVQYIANQIKAAAPN